METAILRELGKNILELGVGFAIVDRFHGALVRGQGVVGADFVVVQAEVFATLGGSLQLFSSLLKNVRQVFNLPENFGNRAG